MRILRITLEGVTASFRHPHFMLGRQPSFDMPPPATIYGHLSSALGDWFDPAGVRFAYAFTSERKFADLEHIHVLSRSTGKLKGTDLPKVQEGNVQPYSREILFRPKLTLYVNRPGWIDAFRSPRYAVALGRSQDLCAYTDVREIDLDARPAAYLEDTLLPFDFPIKPTQSIVTLMPRWVDAEAGRTAVFERYLQLRGRIATDDPGLLLFGQPPAEYPVDPLSPVVNGLQRGLIFLSFEATRVSTEAQAA